MVSENLYRVSGLSEVVSVVGKSVDNGIKLLIVDIPILLGGMEFMMKKEEGMPPVIVFLLEDTSIGFIGGVGREADGFPRLEGTDIDVVADVLENAVKSFLAFGSPVPGLVFLRQVGQAGGHIGIVGDEFIIETHHPKEGSEIGQPSWRFKVPDALDLVFGHADAFAADNVKSEEVAFFCEPFALMGFKA
jgi:hypothetical protein